MVHKVFYYSDLFITALGYSLFINGMLWGIFKVGVKESVMPHLARCSRSFKARTCEAYTTKFTSVWGCSMWLYHINSFLIRFLVVCKSRISTTHNKYDVIFIVFYKNTEKIWKYSQILRVLYWLEILLKSFRNYLIIPLLDRQIVCILRSYRNVQQ